MNDITEQPSGLTKKIKKWHNQIHCLTVFLLKSIIKIQKLSMFLYDLRRISK